MPAMLSALTLHLPSQDIRKRASAADKRPCGRLHSNVDNLIVLSPLFSKPNIRGVSYLFNHPQQVRLKLLPWAEQLQIYDHVLIAVGPGVVVRDELSPLTPRSRHGVCNPANLHMPGMEMVGGKEYYVCQLFSVIGYSQCVARRCYNEGVLSEQPTVTPVK